jgi:hypothetical protein
MEHVRTGQPEDAVLSARVEERASEIPRGLELTRRLAIRVRDQAIALEKQLAPAMSTTDDPNKPGDVPREPWGTEYGSALGGTADVLEETATLLGQISERLEV